MVDVRSTSLKLADPWTEILIYLLQKTTKFFVLYRLGYVQEGAPMEDLGVRMVGPVQKHLLLNQA